MKIGIKIMPRDVILDSQGREVEQSMKSNGFNQIIDCRVGKYLELNLSSKTKEEAQVDVEKMLKEGGLYNPLIEKYEVQTY